MNNQIWLQRPKGKKEKWSSGVVGRVGEIINGDATFCITSETWCYQSPGLSSFDCRLSIPLLSINRF
nr:hypothetical protein CFP56_49011 [Quercus suber]